jgi:hypothetical protein
MVRIYGNLNAGLLLCMEYEVYHLGLGRVIGPLSKSVVERLHFIVLRCCAMPPSPSIESGAYTTQ